MGGTPRELYSLVQLEDQTKCNKKCNNAIALGRPHAHHALWGRKPTSTQLHQRWAEGPSALLWENGAIWPIFPQ